MNSQSTCTYHIATDETDFLNALQLHPFHSQTIVLRAPNINCLLSKGKVQWCNDMTWHGEAFIRHFKHNCRDHILRCWVLLLIFLFLFWTIGLGMEVQSFIIIYQQQLLIKVISHKKTHQCLRSSDLSHSPLYFSSSACLSVCLSRISSFLHPLGNAKDRHKFPCRCHKEFWICQ